MDRFVPRSSAAGEGGSSSRKRRWPRSSRRWPSASPKADLAWLALLACWWPFASARRTSSSTRTAPNVAKPEQRGLAAAFTVVGYRSRMLTSGAAALVLVAARASSRRWAEEHLSPHGRAHGVGAIATLWDRARCGGACAAHLEERCGRRSRSSSRGRRVVLLAHRPLQAGRRVRGLAHHGIPAAWGGVLARRRGLREQGHGARADLRRALWRRGSCSPGSLPALMAFGILQASRTSPSWARRRGKSWPS